MTPIDELIEFIETHGNGTSDLNKILTVNDIYEYAQALQLLQPDVSGSLPNKTQLKWIDDFVPCYVTECCGVGPIVNEKFCPTCGKEIQRQ